MRNTWQKLHTIILTAMNNSNKTLLIVARAT